MMRVGLYAIDGAFVQHVDLSGPSAPRVIRLGDRTFVCADVLAGQYREAPAVALCPVHHTDSCWCALAQQTSVEADLQAALGQRMPHSLAAPAAHT